jgi:hypothetical protein
MKGQLWSGALIQLRHTRLVNRGQGHLQLMYTWWVNCGQGHLKLIHTWWPIVCQGHLSADTYKVDQLWSGAPTYLVVIYGQGHLHLQWMYCTHGASTVIRGTCTHGGQLWSVAPIQYTADVHMVGQLWSEAPTPDAHMVGQL